MSWCRQAKVQTLVGKLKINAENLNSTDAHLRVAQQGMRNHASAKDLSDSTGMPAKAVGHFEDCFVYLDRGDYIFRGKGCNHSNLQLVGKSNSAQGRGYEVCSHCSKTERNQRRRYRAVLEQIEKGAPHINTPFKYMVNNPDMAAAALRERVDTIEELRQKNYRQASTARRRASPSTSSSRK